MDFKNSDITTGQVIDLNGADAAVALEAAATLAVAMQAANILPLTADGQLILPAGVGLDDIKVVGRDLVIQMPDGTQMIVPDAAIFVPQIVVDGVTVPALNIAALLIGQEPEPAAGRLQSSGGNFADPVGDIGDAFDLGDLLPPTQLAFPENEEREIVPNLVDQDPDVVIQDGGPASRDVVDNVSEVGLPGTRSNGNVESPGSSTGNGADSTTGTIFVTSPDGIASITINGVVVTGAAGQQIVTARGVLTLGALSDGQIGYTYRLTDNTSGDTTTDVFTVLVTDPDGDVASARLTINIADDVPTARNDTDSVPAGIYTGQTGNVITGVGTTSGNAGADTQGADAAVLSGFRAGTGTGTFVAAGTTINGQYGTLTISANGSYTYTRNAGTPGGVNDVFTYQITDGDGDSSTATLTISIADSPVTITFVPTTGAGTVVDEAGLPARGTEPPGSNAAAPSESTSGTITFTAPDGISSVAINGVNITGAGQVITVPTGTLLITGYNAVTGTLTYTFTLTDNTSGDATTQVFTITVTDTDGDTASSPFTVRIIDDVPTARNDSGTQATENAPVTVNIIANDTQGADGVNLATGVALVAGSLSGTGTLVYNGNGTFTYTPAPGEEGVVTFNYTITDGDGDVSTATVTINLLEDSVPTLSVAGDQEVNESGLPAREGEPEGSDASAPSETAVGTITVGTGGDSVASLVINGVNVTAGGTVTTALGTLVITVSGGVYSYSYTLTDNTLAATSSDTFTIVLTDSDGDTASSNLVIAIIDDAPTAVADTDSIAAGSYGPATGNVISDSEGDGGKDVQGADGVTVTNVAGAGGSGGAGTAINGLYGVLTLNADGSYSYVRNAASPGGVSDVFTYTITDGDGDTSTTTLTIAIADSPVSLTLPVKGAAGTVVDEAGLPAGSNAASDSEKTAGTIAYVAADGPATVTIDGVAVTAVGQTFTGSFGTLTITSIANGVIGYEYLLTTNTAGDATFDDFAIVITDQDGDSSNGTLVIDIVDDVPTARADVDSVTEDAATSADGNVLTGVGGVDANGTDGVADTQGADGASVTSVAFGATAGTIGGSTAGEYGTLTLNADGSYSYVLNNSDPRIQGLDGDETLTEIFTYTITDGDGDARTTTLTITINGSDDPITINGLNIEGPELVVDDDDLPDGSSPNAPALTKTGSFTVNGVDGIASIKVGGTEVFVGQTITTASGTFTITAISSPADGNADSITISYSFTLNDNTTHPGGAGENSITESFEVVVTDTDGSTDTDFIDVRIIDDVPTAVNDTDSIAAGEFGPATGNVITDGEGDGGADTRGADGASVTAIVGAVAGTVGSTTAGLYGVLTLNADGSYSYVRNAGTPGGVSDVFTYTITDSDGDTATATLTIAIADATPLAGPNAAVLLDDDALAGGNAGGTGDDVDAANLTGMLAASGGDGPLSWAYQLGGAPAGFTYTANGSGIDVFQGATKVLAITLNTATGAYTVTQLAPIVHASGSAENNQGFTISYNVTDTDGDASSGTLTINVDDDTPTASNDVDEILSGSNAPATGNVITDAEGDGGADSVGADGGAAIVAITGFGGVGTVGGVTNGQYGVLTINADGSYSYVRNAGTPGNVEDVFTYTLTDADGDTVTATLTISIEDARPITGLNATVLLDDDALAGGNAGGTGDDANAANLNGTLAGSGGDGALTWAYVTPENLGGFTYVANGTGLDVFQGATKVLVITLNSATGAYSVAQVAPIVHANGGDENNQIFAITYTVTDADGDAATGTLTIDVDDDSPTATDDGLVTIEGAPAIIGNVLSNDSVGADAPGTVTLVGAAAIGANTVIVGTYGTLTISSNGSYSYVPNASVPSGSVDSFTYTMRDADGDTATATLRFTFDGDANRPTAGATNASVDDDALGGNAGGTGDLPDANADGDGNQATFSGTLPLNFGLDGAGKVSFAHLHNQFVIVGTESVQLKWVEATSTLTATGVRGDLFTLVVNQATGAYTLTLLDNVLHNGGGAENDATTVLTYVVTDSDGSTAPGTLTITFDDDTPVAVADTDAVTEDGTTTATGNVLTGVGTDGNAAGADSFGADGQSPLGAVTAITGGALGVAIVGTYGSLTLNADGSYSFVLNNASLAVQGLDSGETATEVYTYTIRDGDGDETTATLTITINGTNDAPVVGVGTARVSEEGLPGGRTDGGGTPDDLTNSVTANGTISISDVDGEAQSVTLGDPGAVLNAGGAAVTWTGIGTQTLIGRVGLVEVIRVTIDNSGNYSVLLSKSVDHPTINAEDLKSFVVPVNVSDGTVTVPTTLTVIIEDDSATAVADSNSGLEGAVIAGTVLGNDFFGADGPATTVPAGGVVGVRAAGGDTTTPVTTGTGTVINGLYGTLTLNADGTYSYDGNPNAIGSDAQDVFVYTIRDADGDTSTTTLTINLTNIGVTASDTEALVYEAGLASGSNSGANSEIFNGAITPAGGTIPYSYTLTSLATGTYGTLVLNPDGTYTYTLTQRYDTAPDDNNGTNTEANRDVFTYTVTDINGNTTTGTINVSIVDDVPTAVSETARSVAEDAADIGGNVLSNDTQGADGATVTSVTINTAGGPLVQAIAAVGTTTVTTSYGTYTFTAAGAWTFNPSANLNNAAGVDAGFSYTITDGDGDKSTASQPITVTDGANPTTAKSAVIALDEEGLGTANATGTNPAATSESASDTVSFTGGSDNIASVVFGSTAGITLTGYAGAAITWSAGGGNTVTGTIGGIVAITLTLSSVTTGATAGANVTATLSDNFIHLSGSGENSISILGVSVVATDTDGDTAAATVALTVRDDVPLAVQPKAAVLTNSAGSTGGNFLDDDNDVDNDYGADGGKIIFTAATVTSLLGQNLTSGFSSLAYSISPDGTLLTATKTVAGVTSTVFTVALQPVGSPDQYVVTMSQPLDSKQTVDFNDGSYDLVGGNTAWVAFSQPAIVNSDDVMLTAMFNGVDGGTVNANANETGISAATGAGGGGQAIGTNEALRIDFVKDVTGSPNSGADYGDLANQNHAFTAHYNVNGASVLFSSINNASTVRFVARDDIDTDNDVGDGTKDNINGVAISFNGSTVLVSATTASVMVGGRSFGVTFLANGEVTVSNVANGARVAAFTSTGYNSLEVHYSSGDTFKIGDFGASVIKNQPVSFTVPVTITDNDGDAVPSGSLAITLNPAAGPAPLVGEETALPGETMLLALDDELEAADAITATATTTLPADLRMAAEETAAPATVPLVATDKAAEQVRNTSNVTATVIAAALVGLPGIADALAAPAPDATRLEMLPDQETAMPDQVDLVGGDDNIVNEGEAGLSADTETTRISDDEDSSLQAADDDATAALDAQPLTPLSEGFTGGADVVDIADILPSASPMGSDAVMHNILDLAAAGLAAASNDNPVELAIENVVDEALPDTMIDRLVEAFEADADAPVVSAASASDSSGYLVELINQSVSSSPDFATIHVDPFGSQYNDMTTTNNG